MRIFYRKKFIGTLMGTPSVGMINAFVASSFTRETDELPDTALVIYEPESDAERKALVGFEHMPQSTLTICKQWAMNRIKNQHAEALKMLSGDTTTEERDTWPDQRAAAKAFIGNKADDIQKGMLDALLLPSETKTALSQRILAKSAAMQTLIGMAGGLKRKAEQAVESADSVEEVELVMTTAGKQMEAAITQFQQQMAATTNTEESS